MSARTNGLLPFAFGYRPRSQSFQLGVQIVLLPTSTHSSIEHEQPPIDVAHDPLNFIEAILHLSQPFLLHFLGSCQAALQEYDDKQEGPAND
jgi:hypothetical protein